jgi:hypothetical protein
VTAREDALKSRVSIRHVARPILSLRLSVFEACGYHCRGRVRLMFLVRRNSICGNTLDRLCHRERSEEPALSLPKGSGPRTGGTSCSVLGCFGFASA